MSIIQQTLTEMADNLMNLTLNDQGIGSYIDSAVTICNASVLKLAKAMIEEKDQIIFDNPDVREGYTSVRKSKRTLETKVGTLTYLRRYYFNKELKIYKHLVDELIEVERYQRVENSLQISLITDSCDHSYQKSSEINTDNRVSRTSVMNFARKINVPKEIKHDKIRETDVLHIQADEDHFHYQKAKPNGGQLKLAVIHEPKQRVSKGRYHLPQREILTSVSQKPDDFWERVGNNICNKYDYNSLKTIYLHGDGAGWIKKGLEWLPGAVYVLDRFHQDKAIRSVCGGNLRDFHIITNLIYPLKAEALKEKLAELVKSDVCDIKVAKKFYTYVTLNEEGIANDRSLNHEGSCAEGLVSHILSKRFSRHPVGWSLRSIENLSSARAYICSGRKLCTSMLKQEGEKVDPPTVSRERVKTKPRTRQSIANLNVTASIPGSENRSSFLGSLRNSISRLA